MCEPAKRDHSYLVYHFEMGSVDGTYSNIAFGNDESSAGSKRENTAWDTSQTETNSVKKENSSQCKNSQHTYETVDRNAIFGGENWEREKMDVHSPWFNSEKTSVPEGQRKERSKSLNCFAVESNGDVYVKLRNEKESSRTKASFQENGGKQKEPDEETVLAGNKQNMSMLKFRKSIQLMAILQVLIFLMAAVSLALVIMLINGTIVSSAAVRGDAAKPEKQTEVPINEMKAEIAKLKEDLDNAREELQKLKNTSDSLRKKLQEMKNFTPVKKSSERAEKVSFELMLNSSQQSVMNSLSAVWSSLNTTDKERREEATHLRFMANSTKAEIRKVSDSLKKLEAKVRVEEKRLNETMHLKERHSKDLASLTMLMNRTRMDVMNMEARLWKSMNSTDKKGDNEIWVALNNTKRELQQKINNISKMAGPIGPPGFNGSLGPIGPRGFNGSQGFAGPPGFNGSQGPSGPKGSMGPPGPKGAGDFSACQYKTKTGTTGGGSSDDSDAFVDEPSGSVIIAATCSTNYAAGYNLLSTLMSQRRYICNCKGRSGEFHPGLGVSKTCYLHYWLCPKT